MSDIPSSSSIRREKPGGEILHRRSENIFLKLALGGLFGFVFLVAVIWGGGRYYVRWQEKRLSQKGEIALQQGDLATANLAARAVLQLKPDSLRAARLEAEMAERADDRSAVMWRRKAVQSPGNSSADILAWAKIALQFNDVPTAKTAISQLTEQDRNSGGFHALAALIAQADKQDNKAASEWGEAVRLAPEDNSYQLQLGTALMRLNDRGRRDAGAAILNNLRSDPKYHTAAIRALINGSIAQYETADKILELAHDLQNSPNLSFTDRILTADLLRQGNDPQFASYLTELEKAGAACADDLGKLLGWMSQTNLNLLALDFIRTLKPDLLQAWPVPLMVADIYVRLNDWAALETVTKSQTWPNFEFLRHAYLARALRGKNKTAAADSEWAMATKAAAPRSENTFMLLGTAANWNWRNEHIDLMWAMTKYPGKEREALQTLYAFYMENHDTHGLYRVWNRLAEQNPDNLDIQNNVAQVSLLLESKTEDARRVAADIYHKQPHNPAYATTYAFSLLTRGDSKGAVKVMSSLTEDQLKDQAVSVYYGVCLAALNDPRAGDFLDAGKDAILLPEEQALVEKARSGLRSTKQN
jgi:Flp pilus assembly protein TadD